MSLLDTKMFGEFTTNYPHKYPDKNVTKVGGPKKESHGCWGSLSMHKIYEDDKINTSMNFAIRTCNLILISK